MIRTFLLFLKWSNSFAALAPDREVFFKAFPGLTAQADLDSLKVYGLSVPHTLDAKP